MGVFSVAHRVVHRHTYTLQARTQCTHEHTQPHIHMKQCLLKEREIMSFDGFIKALLAIIDGDG